MTTPTTDARGLVDHLAGTTVYVGGGEYSADALVPAPFAALRAVLDLHEPFTVTSSRFKPQPVGCCHCSEAPDLVKWPCPTVRAITDALEAS